MIRPTLPAVLLFSGGVPLALFIVIADPNLWALSFDYGLLVLIVGASDFALACPSRSLSIKVAVPDRLYIGERGATEVKLAAGGFRRAVRFAAIAEQRGDLEPSEIFAGEIVPGAEARLALPVVPRRRGRVFVDRIWLRLSLIHISEPTRP